MDTNDLHAAPRPDDDAEEGELSEEAAVPLQAGNDNLADERLVRDAERRGRSIDLREGGGGPDRWRHHSRSCSPPHDNYRRGNDRLRDSREPRRDRSRSPRDRRHDRGRDRDRGDRYRRYSRSRSRDRGGGGGRGGGEAEEKRQAELAAAKAKAEQKADEEAFQARVAASLAAQEEEEDEEKLIEERRRRRQEILAKHRQQQQRQQSAGPSVVTAPEGNGGAVDAAENNNEDAVVAELGVEQGGALDIWRHDGSAVAAAGTAEAGGGQQRAASGIGEAHGAELDRRLHAAAAAQHLEMKEQPHGQKEDEDEEEDDMFAETPEDVRQANQTNAATTAATTTTASVRRGLVDNYDDAEGYYNFQVGEIIGSRYEVFKAHGRGVFSSVLRARDLGTNISPPPEVAIKVIRANETMYKAGQVEKVILRKLAEADPEGKRHCIRLLGSFEYRSHLCLVFEPMDMDLRALTKRYGRGIGLSLSAVRIYTQQMLVALHHLRNCGVLHADLKPDNLLVNDRRTVVKLCDFGSAMFAGDNEITPYLVSRFYRAPEVILGLPYDHPMDIWSVGCVVYELFTGQILFPGRTNNEMLKLMMEVKGQFSKKMLKKAEFAFKHFEADPNMTFALLEEDAVTKRPVRRLIPNPQVKNDFSVLLAGLDSDRKKLAQLADLLERMMVLDPDKRITPKDALKHPFFELTAAPKRVVTAAPRAINMAVAASRK
ncbi:putative Serine/threonine-protein kinase PRP4-like protein [Nannochloris sp. 'desiccata']|nr:putative Serine/threonine-protein kinase PRP4-like protein [Chlorella desiccata (nom. nud.)]